MKRREALKNIGLSLGAVTMSSTLVSLIQSCSKGATWGPKFFSIEEAEIVTKTLDVILPVTPNIPGAKELNLTQFIDGYVHKISNKKEKETIKLGISSYLSTTLKITGKRKAIALTTKEIDNRLAFYLKADAEQQKVWDAEITNTITSPSEDAINYNVLKSLRSKGISAFKISEQIGENVLAYDPVPGKQIGCVSLQEATQGKAWSLTR